MYLAVEKGNIEIIKLLFAHDKTDINAKNVLIDSFNLILNIILLGFKNTIFKLGYHHFLVI